MRTWIIRAAAMLALAFAPAASAQEENAAPAQYQNFSVAIYVVVNSTRQLADPAVFERQFQRIWSQVKFDKVYIEAYRNHQFATDEELDAVIAQFRARGIAIGGGITPAAGGSGGQFGTFDYENPEDMAECRRAVELAARHFDELILDDFFFYNTKSPLDIAARGDRPWSEYRVERMRQASRECVIEPARAINPDIRLVIKYPNWYEHFLGTGFDLDEQPHMFDAIYTGTETRDPEITDQLLQQYESYQIYRYFSNIRPDRENGIYGNGGGWVDTFDTRYVDRYAEQLWLTMFAKAPEITLFNWANMANEDAIAAGTRPWANRNTSFNWRRMQTEFRASNGAEPEPGWASVAGDALRQIDGVVGALGHPIGLASYRPAHASGEDYLHNYLGNIGIPIELSPTYPALAETVLLTESAAADPSIVDHIHQSLIDGHNVIITSGLLCALDDRGIDRIVELDCTGRRALINTFINGYGAGAGDSLNDPDVEAPPVLFPEIRFFTNDSWPIIRGVAGARGFPIVLMNRYARGVIYVLNIPDNPGDLYNLPRPLLTQIRAYLMGEFPVRLDSDARVALFAYDNQSFIVHSFRDAPSEVTISVTGEGARIFDVVTGAELPGQPPLARAQNWRSVETAPRTEFRLRLEPHSYRAFRLGG